MMSKTPTRPAIQLKIHKRIGRWNVRSPYQHVKAHSLAQEMRRLEVDTLGCSEVRWYNSGRSIMNNYVFFYSGDNIPRNHNNKETVRPGWRTWRIGTSCVQQKTVAGLSSSRLPVLQDWRRNNLCWRNTFRESIQVQLLGVRAKWKMGSEFWNQTSHWDGQKCF